MDRFHHTTLVPAEVLAQLERLTSELRIDSVNGAVELVLDSFTDSDLAVAVYAAVPGCARFRLDDWERLQLRLPRPMIARIDEAFRHTPLQKMRIVGALLAGNIDQLQRMIAAARGGQTNEETRNGSTAGDRPPG